MSHMKDQNQPHQVANNESKDTAPGPYPVPPPAPMISTHDHEDYSHHKVVPPSEETKFKGHGFWRGCCAGMCCYCCLDMCF